MPSRIDPHHPSALVLSIRPTYVERILAGLKTVELRRRFSSAAHRATALLYSTSPVQAIVGEAIIEAVEYLPLPSLWRRYARAAAVTREEFDRYFCGVEMGCALRLVRISALETPIHLTELVRQFEFAPPQSYCYWRKPLKPTPHGRAKTSPRR